MNDSPSSVRLQERKGRPPLSTYRIQFHRGFRFEDARGVVAYLDALGVTDCYSSPHLRASPGSSHGYDICDHDQLNPEIGGKEEYASFTGELAAHGMGQIVDFVPNHMGVDAKANPWWRDVLENGRCSPYADYFDIDWTPVKAELRDKVLLPILGDQYGVVLERGELLLVFDAGGFTLRYFERDLPINPRQFPRILEHGLDALASDLGAADPSLVELLSILTALRNLPAYYETDAARVAERQREKEVARQRLRRLVEASAIIRDHVEAAVRLCNGIPGDAASFDRLHELLEQQPYRLAYWRTAAQEINYRRFFDINELGGLRMDDPRVFRATHEMLLGLVREGKVTGLRLDHIDGLFDPARYLAELRAAIDAPLPSHSRTAPGGESFYVVVEKILSPGESLPASWPVAGTSGYEFLNDVNGIFVDRPSQRTLARIYRRFAGAGPSFTDLVYRNKKLVMDQPMASELNMLAAALNRLSEEDRRTRDFTLGSLRQALRELVACFPIYRTYVSPAGCKDMDRDAVDSAIRRARRRNPTMEPSVFQFLRSVLLPREERQQPAVDTDPVDETGHTHAGRLLEFAMKFQQYTGPVHAKGVEDTTFYQYNLLASLNEVGGDPASFGRTVDEFHAANHFRQARWPQTMLATATHDTKRGEDTRARLNALSELAEEWGRQLSRWARINAVNRGVAHGEPAPDRNDEYLFYQSLLGIWPPGHDGLPGDDLRSRLQAYMRKAAREAKTHTSWIHPDTDYEAALDRFVEATLAGRTTDRFLASFLPFQARVAEIGLVNSLAQLALKSTSPGVPDFYQGSELWDLSLVDPDNRRPVDFALRRRHLAALRADVDDARRRETVRELLACWQDGRIKMFVTAALLRFRRAVSDLFLEGSYEPLGAEGERADRIVAFARRHCGGVAIIVVPRLVAAITTPDQPLPLGRRAWGETRLALPADLAGLEYRDVLTGNTFRFTDASAPIAQIFDPCPVAVLARMA